MKDLHINIGGPRDRARQQVSFKIAQGGNREGLDAQAIGHLVTQLRTAIESADLKPDELKRANRHLTTIEEEAKSDEPAQSEIGSAITFLNGLMQSAHELAPLCSNTLSLLARAVGISAA